MWQLIITRESNGYHLKTIEDQDITDRCFVIQDDDKDELKSHEELLYEVMDYFDFRGSKHDAERLRITRENGEEQMNWPRIRDLPEEERVQFIHWLLSQTRPWLDGVPEDEQDGYYQCDYERWKAGLPVID